MPSTFAKASAYAKASAFAKAPADKTADKTADRSVISVFVSLLNLITLSRID
jgi:hypothetical protein